MTRTSTNPYKKGDTAYHACIAPKPNGGEDVHVVAVTVKSTFGDDEINLTARTPDHRSRLGIAEVAATPDEAVAVLVAKLDGVIATLKESAVRHEARRAKAAALLPRVEVGNE